MKDKFVVTDPDSTDIEEELRKLEELQAIGPKGVAYQEHLEALLDQVVELARANEIPIFIFVGLDREGRDDPASLVTSVASKGPDSKVYCGDTLRKVISNLFDVAHRGAVAVPKELAELLSIQGMDGGVAMPVQSGSPLAKKLGLGGPSDPFSAITNHQDLPPEVQAELLVVLEAMTKHPDRMDEKMQGQVLQFAELQATCDCPLCATVRKLAEVIRARRRDQAN